MENDKTFEVREFKEIEPGAYNGVIVEIEYREIPYKYTDIIIEFLSGVKLKYGVPTPMELTEKNKLGKLLKIFGAKLEPGVMISPRRILIGKKCTFIVTHEEKDGTKYARIMDKSLKPLIEE